MSISALQLSCDPLSPVKLGQSTQWFVISGPPSSGKTTLLSELAARGYRTSPDISRQYITSLSKSDGVGGKAQSDPVDLQTKILKLMLDAEGNLPAGSMVFLDYALPDNLAFWEKAKLSITSDVWKASVRFRYRHVFLLEPLPFVEDGIRNKEDDNQQELHMLQESYYRALGYRCTHVAAASVSARTDYVISIVHSLGGSC